MHLKKLYTYTNNRQLWRLLPNDNGQIIIEDRDPTLKEVFFNCIDMQTGKPIFNNLQFEEKYWIGIEAVTGDLILFHKFVKPDLPAHLGIMAFDIRTRSVIWETYEYNFLFINDNKIYTFRSGFEGKQYFVLDLFSGEMIESLGDNSAAVNILKQNSSSETYYNNFKFPQSYDEGIEKTSYSGILDNLKNVKTITGKVDYLMFNNLLLVNYHEVMKQGTLKNTFTAIDIHSKKIIFEETLNAASTTIMPDSFFMVDSYLLLLKEKTKLIVCAIKD